MKWPHACALALLLSTISDDSLGATAAHIALHIAERDVPPRLADQAREDSRAELALYAPQECPKCTLPIRLQLLAAMAWGTGPSDAMLAELDTLRIAARDSSRVLGTALALAAQGLLRRAEMLERARQLAVAAVAICARDDPFDRSGVGCVATLAGIQAGLGHPDSAAALWQQVLSENRYVDEWDHYYALLQSASALESSRHYRAAFERYLEAAELPFQRDTSAALGVRGLARSLGLSADSILAKADSVREARYCKARDEYFVSSKVVAFHANDQVGVRHDQTELEGTYSALEWRDYGCAFCRRSAAQWRTLSRRLQAAGLRTREFAIISGLGTSDAREFVTRVAGTGDTVCIDRDALLASTMGVDATPAVYLANAERRIRYRIVGNAWVRREVILDLIDDMEHKGGRIHRGCE